MALETYTASGRIRGGPVQPQEDLSTATLPARALGGLGNSLQGLGQDVAQISEQRNKENELRWATESAAQFDRVLTDRRLEDSKDPSETSGFYFRQFADEQVAEYAKKAPSQRAADLFRAHAMRSANQNIEESDKFSERTRLTNADIANDNAVADIVASYKNTVQLDSADGAARDISPLVNLQLASIKERFGQTAPALAERMTMRVVEEVAYSTASTNPDYARKMVEKAPISEEQKLNINTRIDRIERDSTETAVWNYGKLIDNSIANGYDKLQPVPMPSKEMLSVFPQNQQQKIAHDVSVANGTISQFSKVRSWNWQEQQKAIASIKIEGSPINEDVRKNLVKLTEHAKKQQTEDPAAWQMANDPEFSIVDPKETTVQRMSRIGRMVSLQGVPPPDTSEEQKKRYLNLPTGLANVFSTDQAKARAAQFNNSPPNQLTQMVDSFNAEFPNPTLAAIAWNDMQNLPEGEGKLRMGLRVGASINDLQVRNRFLGLVGKEFAVKPKDPQSAFELELDGNPDFNKFVDGWKGDNQRSTELKEFRDSILSYSMHLSADEHSKTSGAVEKAVKQVINDNYGIMTINGSNVPVWRFPAKNYYTDDDARLMSIGIQEVLHGITKDNISTSINHFPLAPRLPGDQTEANNYINKLMRSTSTVIVEPNGLSATVYLRGEGENDVAFQVRGTDGQPLYMQFEQMKMLGMETEARKVPATAYGESVMRLYEGMSAEQKAKTSLENMLKGGPLPGEGLNRKERLFQR